MYAHSRLLVDQLLQENSEYKPHESRFNHEAIAILLQHRNEKLWKKQQVYLAAGTEDLIALLPRLELAAEGSEAFIYLRHQIHSMVVYLLREEGQLRSFVFDSQSWGTAYYGISLILFALTRYDPEIIIYLSGKELQPQNVQRGCTEFAFGCMDYLVNAGKEFMRTAFYFGYHQIYEYDNAYHLVDRSCPDALQQIDPVKLHVILESELGQLLQDTYQNNGKLNREAINAVIDRMHGMHVPLLTANISALYDIHVDLDQMAVTLKFLHQDYHRGTCWIYKNVSEALQPIHWNAVLQDNPLIHISRDLGARTLRYQAKNMEDLIAAFEGVTTSLPDLSRAHMHQQLGLMTGAGEVVRAIKAAQSLKLAVQAEDPAVVHPGIEEPNFLYRLANFHLWARAWPQQCHNSENKPDFTPQNKK